MYQMKSTFPLTTTGAAPIGAVDKFKGVVDLIRMKALIFEAGSANIANRHPADMMDYVETYKEP